MEVHFGSELQSKIERLVLETGRPANELVEDAMTGYFAELAATRESLDRRYDEVKSGRVQLIDGDEAYARLMKRTAEQRSDAR
jgi:hypothetical protein